MALLCARIHRLARLLTGDRSGRHRKRQVQIAQQLLLELSADVPRPHRAKLDQSLGQLRSADDLPHVRAAFFNVVAHCHGESAARARLQALDRGLAQ